MKSESVFSSTALLAKKVDNEYRFAVCKIVSMNNSLYVLGATVSEDFKKMLKLVSFAIHHIKDSTITDKIWDFQLPD